MNESTGEQVVVSSETIKQSPLGAALSQAQCEALARVATARALREGEFLITEGGRDYSIHVITKGKLEVVKATGGAEWVTLHVMRAGDIAGEKGFIDGVEHSAGLRALSDTEVFTLERSKFEALLTQDPRLVYEVMRALIRAVHANLRRMNVQFVEMSNYITKEHGRY
jgi:CRP-like cAMP-binding protein